MAQRARILRRPRPSLKHIARELVRLLDAMDELEDLNKGSRSPRPRGSCIRAPESPLSR
jgi:hypothetical protein